VDGKKVPARGDRPSVEVKVTPGKEHTIQASKTGFKAYAQKLDPLGEGERLRMEFSLQPEQTAPAADGVLVVEVSEPGAEIFIDGILKRQTSRASEKWETSFAPDRRFVLEVRKTGFEDERRDMFLGKGERREMRVTLQKKADGGAVVAKAEPKVLASL